MNPVAKFYDVGNDSKGKDSMELVPPEFGGDVQAMMGDTHLMPGGMLCVIWIPVVEEDED